MTVAQFRNRMSVQSGTRRGKMKLGRCHAAGLCGAILIGWWVVVLRQHARKPPSTPLTSTCLFTTPPDYSCLSQGAPVRAISQAILGLCAQGSLRGFVPRPPPAHEKSSKTERFEDCARSPLLARIRTTDHSCENCGPHDSFKSEIRKFPRKWRARQDSNLWPSA